MLTHVAWCGCWRFLFLFYCLSPRPSASPPPRGRHAWLVRSVEVPPTERTGASRPVYQGKITPNLSGTSVRGLEGGGGELREGVAMPLRRRQRAEVRPGGGSMVRPQS